MNFFTTSTLKVEPKTHRNIGGCGYNLIQANLTTENAPSFSLELNH